MSLPPLPIITVTAHDSAAVVSMLESRLDMERALEFKARVEEVIDGGATQIVLDMSEVTYMDSSGLGTVVSVFKRMPSGSFNVTGLRPNVRTLFQITRLDRFINVYATVDEAVAAFRRA